MIKPIALSMGEPAGIGAEISLKAWRDYNQELDPFFLIDCPDRLHNLSQNLGWDIPIQEIIDPAQAIESFKDYLPVLKQTVAPSTPGVLSAENAKNVILSIDQAVRFVQQGHASAVVTNPIQKHTLQESGFGFPGHTEYLAELAQINTPPIMMLASDELKVVPLTVHYALRDALNQITEDLIIEKCQITANDLKTYFNIENPRLAIAGINPHGGENGAMGREEIELIEPAIDKMKKIGLNVSGPYSADTMFHAGAREYYDVAMCMYHDQALIPIKTIAFDEGVNVTLGLPFIRTSPDHGTALNIAGKGIANSTSLVCAIKLAAKMAKNQAIT